MFSKKFKAFTLVEMLIVIVIIGLLASSLIPKIVGMQAKARDTARKADLNNLVTIMEAYYADFGKYPAGSGSITVISGDIADYTNKLPKDPSGTSRICQSGVVAPTANYEPGNYLYTRISRNGMANSSFVVMGCSEEFGAGSNWVAEGSGIVDESDDTSDLAKKVCERVGKTGGSNSLDSCVALEDADVRRYILIH